MGIEVSSISDVGLKRKVNQDSILVYRHNAKQFYLFAVADGMGGYSSGEKASGAITAGLRSWLDASLPTGGLNSPTAVFTGLGEQLSAINRSIRENYNNNQICGSTCTLLFIQDDLYGVFNVGDSRVYRAHGLLGFDQLTQDDVWENQPQIRAQLSATQRAKSPEYGKLTQAVGVKDELNYSMSTGRLQQDSVFALCSDGVYKMVSERFFRKAVASAKRRPLDEVCEEIKREVYRCGAGDNLSLILVRWSRK